MSRHLLGASDLSALVCQFGKTRMFQAPVELILQPCLNRALVPFPAEGAIGPCLALEFKDGFARFTSSAQFADPLRYCRMKRDCVWVPRFVRALLFRAFK
jgi:hypothetical protein